MAELFAGKECSGVEHIRLMPIGELVPPDTDAKTNPGEQGPVDADFQVGLTWCTFIVFIKKHVSLYFFSVNMFFLSMIWDIFMVQRCLPPDTSQKIVKLSI